MNFKLSWIKVIVSVVLGFVGNYFLSGFGCFGASYCWISLSSYFSGIFEDVFFWLWIMILAVGVYIIWSLIQKKSGMIEEVKEVKKK